ncbi:di-trans,poly-cis-decaprenylcistransferase, partial [Christensenellaceae bacterium OttesenSCG-928-L17]|nr:di-trans,poly-cis-decaprenylcistransferase [Christensenellaceae bacterium OttesenSCG-928-L17]
KHNTKWYNLSMNNETTPTHLGFIADGNRRWAKERNLPTLEGHRAGLAAIETVATECFNHGVKFVSFYIFSTENWNRSTDEVSYLMTLAQTQIGGLAKKLHKNNIKLIVMGKRDERIPSGLQKSIDKAEALTSDGTKGTLAICFNYDGRQEIIDAAASIQGEITAESLAAHLYCPEVPDCDMIIRTSGEQRISGFQLWRASYSEFLFLEKYWPDMGPSDVTSILDTYASRHRRFGR